MVISEQEISDYYKANKDTYATPEQRTVTQVRVKDQAMAEAIAAKVKGGASLAKSSHFYVEVKIDEAQNA